MLSLVHPLPIGAKPSRVPVLCKQGLNLTGSGASLSHRRNARTIGLTNPWLIRFPYLVREFYFQQLIRKSDQLAPGGKLRLRLWSWWRYGRLVLWLCAGQCYGLLPDTSKRLVKRLLHK